MNDPTKPGEAPRGLLPDAGAVARAGASGAAIAGAWTGINEVIRVRHGEVTPQQAVHATANSAAIGAAAGAVAQIASHVARGLPPLGLAALALGVGAIYLSTAGRPPSAAAAQEDAEDAPKRLSAEGGEA